MKRLQKEFDTTTSQGIVTVTDSQAAALNWEGNESKVKVGEQVIIQRQKLHKEKVTLTLNGKQVERDSAQLYVTIIATDGTTREDTLAASNFNKYSFGKDFTDDVKVKQTPRGVRGQINTKHNLHIKNGESVRFRATDNNEKYFANDVCLLVKDKAAYAFPVMEQNGTIYDYKSQNGYLEIEQTDVREYENIAIPAIEVTSIPVAYRV